MFNEDSSINLSIKLFVNDIIGLATWCHIVTQNGPIIKFGNSTLFPVTANLDLLWVNLVCSSKPSFCYP
jgi:hypothetical protein